jgi:alpha-glucoside transport system permease protein
VITTFIGLDNYRWIWASDEFRYSVRNTVLWLLLVPSAIVGFGLLFAVLSDRVRYESIAKSLIFLPMAISSVASAVIWKMMFDYQNPGPGVTQTGTLNEILAVVHLPPQTWLLNENYNNFLLIMIYVWMQAGFATILISASLKSIPTELIEAARIDGAREGALFVRVILPLLWPTLVMVATTMVIWALRAFDIIYVMTNGNYHTDTIANQFYRQFSSPSYGRSSAMAVVLLLATLPVILYNLRQARKVAPI